MTDYKAESKTTLERLLANLIDKPDQRVNLGSIDENDIDNDLVLHKRLLRAMLWFWEHDQDALKDDLIRALKAYPDYNNAVDKFMEHIYKQRDDTGDVANYAAIFRYQIQIQKPIMAAKKILELSENPGAISVPGLVDKMQRILAESSPSIQSILDTDEDGYMELLGQKQDVIYDRYVSGKTLIPTFPWSGLNELIGGLDIGDPAMIMATMKFGKSTLSQALAKWWAHHGYYVVICEKETSAAIFKRRDIMGMMGLPKYVFTSKTEIDYNNKKYVIPPFSGKNEFWKNVINDYNEKMHNYIKDGKIVHINAPGIDFHSMQVKLQQHKQIADDYGLQMIVIDDYLQRFAIEGNDDEYRHLSKVSEKLKNTIQSLGIYAVIFAQETQVHNGTTLERYPSGSKKGIKVYQITLSLQRKNYSVDEPVLDVSARPTRHLKNGLGMPRYYAKNGGFSGHAEIEVLLANEGLANQKAPLLFENNLYRVYDVNGKPDEYDNLLEKYGDLLTTKRGL